jgi:hypothetical protein
MKTPLHQVAMRPRPLQTHPGKSGDTAAVGSTIAYQALMSPEAAIALLEKGASKSTSLPSASPHLRELLSWVLGQRPKTISLLRARTDAPSGRARMRPPDEHASSPQCSGPVGPNNSPMLQVGGS